MSTLSYRQTQSATKGSLLMARLKGIETTRQIGAGLGRVA
jgi:hypothetical protein